MKNFDANKLSLRECLALLTLLYEDSDCICECYADLYDYVDDAEKRTQYANERAEKCKARNEYEECPQRIAYQRILDALERNGRNENELLPCPFCGGEATMHDSCESWVECNRCGARTKMCACREGAVEHWNRRTK